MKKLEYILKSSFSKSLLVTLALILFCTGVFTQVSWGQAEQSDRQRIVQQVAEKWIQIGLEQYDRRFYKAAEESFLRAKDYEEYLTAAQRENLNGLLDKAHLAAKETTRIESDIAMAKELLGKDQDEKAKALLEGIKQSEFLTQEQHELVEAKLESLKATPSLEAEMAQLYNKSVDLYNAGELEKAREGFLEVAKSNLVVAPVGARAEDYLAKIDAALAEGLISTEEPTEQETALVEEELFGVSEEPAEQDIVFVEEEVQQKVSEDMKVFGSEDVQETTQVETDQEDGGYIRVIERRQNILRSHTKAIVNDALVKAQNYVETHDFDKARKAIEYAQGIVNKNRLHLGEEKFEQYSQELNNLSTMVDSSEKTRAKELEDLRNIEAAKEQQKIRVTMAADRAKRIKELMNNAYAFQKQQRYKEALGQLQSLLAIDPLHNKALILRDTLEDTVSFREQLELQKKARSEKEDLMMEVSDTSIPYAKEITYAKNWKEISAKRQPEEAIGQDPADAKVFKQLDERVDLSELRSDMPFNEAIEILRNSVDPPLNIFVNWRDLYDNADIEEITPINMDAMPSVRLSTGLKLLLEAISGGFAELGYAVEDGLITIATKESIPSEMVTLVYDVIDLVGREADFSSSLGTQQQGGGGGGQGGGIEFEVEEEDERDRDEITEQAGGRIDALMFLIQDTIEPDSWFEVGGEGSITQYQNKLLSIRQTREVHKEIAILLKELRKAHGQQVSIEARYLKVRENFLEDIGLDVDFIYDPHGKWSPVIVNQSSASISATSATGVPGTLGGTDIFQLSGGYGTILDDLQVSFLLRATQAHEDSTIVTAPKATVLSGERATIRLDRAFQYAWDFDIQAEEGTGDQPLQFSDIDYETESIISGTVLNISPTITNDKKHVLLNIETRLIDFLGFREQVFDLGFLSGGGQLILEHPEQEFSSVRTRVNVPDSGTLLLGGQKLSAEIEKEAGVPVLSKIPILGRAFSNRSKIKDKHVLLILVKPTIILQEETEADALASLESGF